MSSIVLHKYKNTTVSRGFSYNYYASPAQDGKPTLLFVHGFPSTSGDWAGVVSVLEPEGYGIIVPDMLGYAPTDRPTDPVQYVGSGITRDLVDLLDAEGVQNAVAVGHDWGSNSVSRLANFCSERFAAFAFITVGYIAPYTTSGLQELMKGLSEKLGYNLLGYFPFMVTHEKLMEQRVDSFLDMIYSDDPDKHRLHGCPEGAFQKWLEADTRCPRLSGPVATPEWAAERRRLVASSMAAPTCWYKVDVLGHAQSDNKTIPQEAYSISKSIFWAGCRLDGPMPPEVGDESLKMFATGSITRHIYDTGHWVILTHYEKLGQDLLAWLKKLPEA
ncbi:alpha/beta-hydrolase [Peniophora sp. CONT]|nr:alpha/beta-hydrolase [Peniophora sp. CONT]